MLVLRFKEITEKIGKLILFENFFYFYFLFGGYLIYLIENIENNVEIDVRDVEINKELVRYDPVLEQPLVRDFECIKRKEVGLWDRLGFYRRDTRRVYICEDLIEQEAEKISSKLNLNYDKFEIYNIVREFVRLHEHIHAYIHKILGDKKIPNYIEEPLTVFVEYSVAYDYIRSDKDLKAIFDYLDKNAPKYYQDWRKLLNIKSRESNRKLEDYLKYEETGVLVLTMLMLLEKLRKVVRKVLRKEDKTYSSFEHYIDENRIVIEKIIDWLAIVFAFLD